MVRVGVITIDASGEPLYEGYSFSTYYKLALKRLKEIFKMIKKNEDDDNLTIITTGYPWFEMCPLELKSMVNSYELCLERGITYNPEENEFCIDEKNKNSKCNADYLNFNHIKFSAIKCQPDDSKLSGSTEKKRKIKKELAEKNKNASRLAITSLIKAGKLKITSEETYYDFLNNCEHIIIIGKMKYDKSAVNDKTTLSDTNSSFEICGDYLKDAIKAQEKSGKGIWKLNVNLLEDTCKKQENIQVAFSNQRVLLKKRRISENKK